MVYEKKQSGDPDFDDKVPAGDHLTLVTAGDGKVVGRVDPALGPVTPEGSHLNVSDPKGEELDTRPAPGDVVKGEKAVVQTYEPEDVPHDEMSLDEVANAQPEDPAQGKAPAAADAEKASTPTTPAAARKTTAPKK